MGLKPSSNSHEGLGVSSEPRVSLAWCASGEDGPRAEFKSRRRAGVPISSVQMAPSPRVRCTCGQTGIEPSSSYMVAHVLRICTIVDGLRPELGTRLATMRIVQDTTFVGGMVLPISEIIVRYGCGQIQAGIAWARQATMGVQPSSNSTRDTGLSELHGRRSAQIRVCARQATMGPRVEVRLKFHERRPGLPLIRMVIVGSTPWLGLWASRRFRRSSPGPGTAPW